MKKIKKFIALCIAFYLFVFIFLFCCFAAALPGSDIIGGTYTYFGFVMLSSVLLYLFSKDDESKRNK